MNVYAYMKRGANKSVSEDSMLINGSLCKEGYYCSELTGDRTAIADGVGGNAGGREASEYLIESFSKAGFDDIENEMKMINSGLIAYAKEIDGKMTMASTFSALINSNEKIIIHTGNTRIYAVRGLYLEQLTRDHTTVKWLESIGDTEGAEAAADNEIISCFGAGNEMYLRMLQITALEKNYKGFVFTSDGIHDHIDDDVLEDFIADGDFSEEAFVSLANTAVDNGSSDDMSIIVLI